MHGTRIVFGAGAIALALVLMAQTGKPSIARGREMYAQQCVACHQADGSGVEGTSPSLVKTKYVLGDKAVLVRIILQGMQGVEIDGERYRNVMAPHADLTDEQIADVLTYVRYSFGNKGSVVTAGEVKAVRGTVK
jgi:mono/diheme cytochrome c family protein